MEVLYAFFRMTDDLSDNGNSPAENAERLDRWRRRTENLFSSGKAAHISGDSSTDSSTNFSADFPADIPEAAVFPALLDTAGRFGIDPENLLAVIDGCRADCAGPVRMETEEAAFDYCDKVASAVGLATLAVLGLTVPLNDEIRTLAFSCGRAFQWTNFLRDIKEDFSRNRCYFPMNDFSAAGLEPASLYALLTSGKENREILSIRLADSYDPLSRFFRIQFERTDSLYREAERLIPYTAPNSSRMFRLMIRWYGGIYQKIKRNPSSIFNRRVHLSFREKWRLLFFSLLKK